MIRPAPGPSRSAAVHYRTNGSVLVDSRARRLLVCALLTATAVLLAGTMARSAEPAKAPKEEFFDSGGVRLRYISQGEGEPVILIHGLVASAEAWRSADPKSANVFNTLAERYHVIALDQRGHGKSDKPHDSAKYGQEMTEDVIRLMDHLHIKKAHVVGYSMGAGVTYSLLAKHGDRMLSATLGAGGPYFPPLWPAAQASLKEWAAACDTESIKDPFYKGADQKAIGACLHSIVDGKPTTEDEVRAVARQHVPTLVIFGSVDLGIKARTDEYRLLAQLLGSELKVVEGGAHVGTESSQVFCDSLRAFLAKHPAGQ